MITKHFLHCLVHLPVSLTSCPAVMRLCALYLMGRVLFNRREQGTSAGDSVIGGGESVEFVVSRVLSLASLMGLTALPRGQLGFVLEGMGLDMFRAYDKGY